MTNNVACSSKRLLLTLTLCACAVILLQNHDLSESRSLPLCLIAMGAGICVCFLFFIPAILLKKRYDSDALTLLRQRPAAVRRTAAAVYCGCFLLLALYFLIPYTDMFCKKYYGDTSPCLIAFLLLVCCVYAAFKGTNVITRFGIFLFVLAMVTNALLFGGSVSSLDFQNGSFGWEGGVGDVGRDLVYFNTPCFTAVLFVCLSGSARQFRTRHVLIALLLTGLKYALIVFFILFAVGPYAFRQEYQTFVLSRVAHFGGFAGIESLYMALSTMSVFMILSLLLCGMGKAVGKSGSLPVTVLLTGLIFALYRASAQNDSFKELLTQPLLLIGLSFFTAVVLPSVLLLRERRRHA